MTVEERAALIAYLTEQRRHHLALAASEERLIKALQSITTMTHIDPDYPADYAGIGGYAIELDN